MIEIWISTSPRDPWGWSICCAGICKHFQTICHLPQKKFFSLWTFLLLHVVNFKGNQSPTKEKISTRTGSKMKEIIHLSKIMIGNWNDLRCPGMCTLGSCWLGCSGPCAEHGTPQSNSLASELSTRNARLLTLSNFPPSLSCILRDFATMLTCYASPFWG